MKKAFTLAEVLLVVAILGITAALTIPNLSNNLSEEETIARLKATYGTVETAMAKLIQEKNGIDYIIRDKASGMPNGYAIGSAISSYLNYSDVCPGGSMEKCFPGLSDMSNIAFAFRLENNAGVAFAKNSNEIYIDTDVRPGTSKSEGNGIFVVFYDNDGLKLSDTGSYTNDNSTAYNSNYAAAWAIINGNMDYLRCSDELDWATKHTCK